MPRSSSCSIVNPDLTRSSAATLSPLPLHVLCGVMEFSAKALRVLITAGAGGIGRVIARTFVEHGAKVHICDVDEKALAGTKKQLPAVTQTLADVSRVADVERLFEDVKKFLHGLDVLVNNAGIAGPTAKVED